jgi:hypothetical protein
MALINLSDWIDRYGDEPDDVDASDLERLTFRAEPEAETPRRDYRSDYRIKAVLPIGSEIADTRTRRL